LFVKLFRAAHRWHTFHQTFFFFQEDCALPHWGLTVWESLNKTFPNRLTGRDRQINWPPGSPDVQPLDFSFWGYIKARVFRRKFGSVVELRARINNAAASRQPRCWKHMVWNRVPFGHSERFKWLSDWDVLKLISCSFKQSKPIACISCTLSFVCTRNVNKLWPSCTFVIKLNATTVSSSRSMPTQEWTSSADI
jgi:hypothetical protein